MKTKLVILLSLASAFVLSAHAGSATWDQNPTSGDWNTSANWNPQTVPNSETDVATFGASSVTNLSNTNADVSLDSAVFNSGAPAYTLTIQIYNLLFYGAGIVNNSGVVQSMVAPGGDNNGAGIIFYNSASAGDQVNFTTVSGTFFFEDSSSAGSAAFNLSGTFSQAIILFYGTSTAGDATINASAGSRITFYDNSTGGSSTLNLSSAAFASFASSNHAEHMNGTCIGGAGEFSSSMDFEGSSDAGDGTYTTVGASTSGEAGAFLLFDSTATADNATFVINGGMAAGLTGTELLIMDSATAANANITANGGADGSEGGAVIFTKKSKGGNASITLNGNAELDITMHNTPGLTIGSLAGAGSVLLAANTLTIGSNNQSTTFSGLIGPGFEPGAIVKMGSGTLTLAGMSLYGGGTTISEGTLLANNLETGSATGLGAVMVNAGILGGRGFVAGATTVGTGSGSGAFLSPSAAATHSTTLTIQSLLTFKPDGTYTCRLDTRKARADEVVASGVTIEVGAQFSFTPVGNKRLRRGQVFTVLNNTAATPISGTFANLPDGSTFTAGRNNFQASYEGGDGNDLVLTVVQ